MNPAKTTAERQRDYVQRQRDAGLREVRNLWAHPDDHAAIREAAAKLARKRARDSSRLSTAVSA